MQSPTHSSPRLRESLNETAPQPLSQANLALFLMQQQSANHDIPGIEMVQNTTSEAGPGEFLPSSFGAQCNMSGGRPRPSSGSHHEEASEVSSASRHDGPRLARTVSPVGTEEDHLETNVRGHDRQLLETNPRASAVIPQPIDAVGTLLSRGYDSQPLEPLNQTRQSSQIPHSGFDGQETNRPVLSSRAPSTRVSSTSTLIGPGHATSSGESRLESGTDLSRQGNAGSACLG
jgi:hypothetical protein